MQDAPHTAFSSQREDMIKRAIFARGARSQPVLEAMRKVPREAFLAQSLREFAYEDACRSTASRPRRSVRCWHASATPASC